jgi:opacity protein-like surface antigen
MKKLLLMGAAFAALIVPAMAAEKPVRVYKRPVVAAAPVSNWSGFLHLGRAGRKMGEQYLDDDFAFRPSVGRDYRRIIAAEFWHIWLPGWRVCRLQLAACRLGGRS